MGQRESLEGAVAWLPVMGCLGVDALSEALKGRAARPGSGRVVRGCVELPAQRLMGWIEAALEAGAQCRGLPAAQAAPARGGPSMASSAGGKSWLLLCADFSNEPDEEQGAEALMLSKAQERFDALVAAGAPQARWIELERVEGIAREWRGGHGWAGEVSARMSALRERGELGEAIAKLGRLDGAKGRI